MKYYIYKNQYDFCFMPKSFSEEKIVYVDKKFNTLMEYLKWIKDNSKENYVGFSLDGMSFVEEPLPDTNFDELAKQNIDMIITNGQTDCFPIHEYYKRKHYDYDIRIALRALRDKSPEYYKEYASHSLSNFTYYIPSAIIRKNLFDEFYDWLYQIKKACNSNLKYKYSSFQQDSFGNLAGILFSIFVMYQKVKIKALYTDAKTLFSYNDLIKDISIDDGLIRKLILDKKPELAKAYLDKDGSKVSESYKLLLKNYQKELRYQAQTMLDKPFNLDNLLNAYSTKVTPINKSGKVLIISWSSINFDSLIDGFQKLGIDFEVYEINELEIHNNITFHEDDNLVKKVKAVINKQTYRFVFTQNYYQVIAEACYVAGIPYLAWEYDCPSMIPIPEIANYETTHIFHFDSSFTNSKLANGFHNMHFLHLAVNTDFYDSIKVTKQDLKKYKADISFVGSLYNFKFTELMQNLSDYSKAYLKAIIDIQQYRHDHSYASLCHLDNLIPLAGKEDFYELARNSIPNTSLLGNQWVISVSMQLYLTNRDRTTLCLLLSKNHTFNLYSQHKLENPGQVKQCGTVDYYKEMPLVFKCSKINLNPTMRTIETGIPQRCLDILGAHSVLMSNYQKDFDERFTDGENVILYETYAEAKEKADFYLAHENLLENIKDNGYETVKKYFSYPAAIQEMIDIAGV